MGERKIVFDGQKRFAMTVCYAEDIANPEHSLGQHTHAECEIYFHLGGDVSFMVEDKIYPIQYGNVILTRQNEYHHCIYHRTTKHTHFCVQFSADSSDRLLEMFFLREKGEGNLLLLSQMQIVELTEICESFLRGQMSTVEKYCAYLKMLCILERAERPGEEKAEGQGEVTTVLQSIQKSFTQKITVADLAAEVHMSVSTLERWFIQHLNMTPSQYIRKLRLENVARMLAENSSVTDAAAKSGFTDVSAMIVQFKRHYGMTPLQYKKQRL